MSSLVTSASLWTNDESQPKKRVPTMRKTIKMKPAIPTIGEPDDYVSHSENYQNLTPSTIDDIQAQNDNRATRVNELLNKITSTNDAVDNNKMGNFNPISPPSITNKKEPSKPPISTAYSGNYSGDEIKSPVYSNYAKSYDATANKPYYANMGISQGTKGGQGLPDDKLIEKINYMIHLLEQQQNEKTSNITEEFILYTMLGVFVIYVVDSFARSGKYIR
jgi:hypothetical protein